MATMCSAPGCNVLATRHGRFCNTHKSRQRRHGASDQQGITKAALTPYLQRVEELRRRNETSPLWDHLERQWAELVQHARDTQAPFLSGRPGYLPAYKAASDLLNLAERVSPSEALHTVIAMFLMQDAEPHRFKSDEAFRRQMVRRVRALTDLNIGTWYDHRSGRVKRAYRDLPPKTAEVLGDWLASYIGGAALSIARREQELRSQREQERAAFQKALEELE